MEARVDANLLETQRISSHGTLSWCCCFKELRDRQTSLIIFVAALYYLSTAVSSIPLTLLINKRISGDAEDPDAK
jgi:F0F1-type ATP synthase membrane subunit c/vacuolar-type H+-ATPase subunit K